MSRVIEKTIYQFDELSDRAKERARDWFRESGGPEDFEYVIDDAVTIGELMGISFDTRTVQLMGGGTRQEPKVYWSLGYCQGDFASFEGTYSYTAGAAKAVRGHAGVDKELHRIVDTLQDAQRRHFYKLGARCRSTHHNNQTVEAYHRDNEYLDIGSAGDEVEQALKDFSAWIYDQLRTEDEWRNADEQVDESIVANEYEFDEDGGRV